jgi:cytochrome c oxidase subunit 3
LDVNIFRQLTEMPWLKAEDTVVDLHEGRAFALPSAKIGLRVFLVVVGVVFSLVVVVYTDRLSLGDWQPLPEPWLLWLNTAILVLSSVAFQTALVAANRGRRDGVRMWLRAAGVLAIAFLAGQLLAWQQLVALGYFAATNPANAFFYLLTALHGLHMVGGLVAWGRTSAKVRRGVKVAQVRLSVELCTIYWHFLLVVWLALFTLLLLT